MNGIIEISEQNLTTKEKRHIFSDKMPWKKSKNTKIILIFALIIVLLSLVAVSVLLLKGGIRAGASSLKNSFTSAFSSEKDAAYDKLYQSAYEQAEENYHVSNAVMISIGNLEETSKLEVLTANAVEFITEDSDDNSGNVTVWIEAKGKGTFVIDLQAAEFIIDNEHHYVLVRIPKPELTNITLISTTTKLFNDGIFDGSISEGVDLSLKQRNEAKLQIQKSLQSNQYIYNNAEKVAIGMIQNLVKQFNTDIQDLEVEVEFIE